MNVRILFLFLIIICTYACKEDYFYEFSLSNESQRTVYMNVQQRGSMSIDTNVISPGSSLVVGIEVVEARNAKKAEDEVGVPFSMLEVIDLEGNEATICNDNLDSRACWSIPEGKRGVDRYRVSRSFGEKSFE